MSEQGGFVFKHFLIQAKLSELGHFRRFQANLMQNKITWLGLRWQYHVAKQFLSSKPPAGWSVYKCTEDGINICVTVPSKVCATRLSKTKNCCTPNILFVCFFGMRAGICSHQNRETNYCARDYERYTNKSERGSCIQALCVHHQS